MDPISAFGILTAVNTQLGDVEMESWIWYGKPHASGGYSSSILPILTAFVT